jgi:hypothetical protein
MASSKKNKNTTPQDQALAAKRVAFVKSKPDLAPAEARTRFFVQTRAAELQAKGVEVTKQKRQELRQKFASGGVQRQGFYTPADIARAAARNTVTGGGATGGSDSSSVGSGQNLGDYKNTVYSNLDKENMARRPVAPKKPDFDKYSMNPAEFLDSPFAKGVVSGAKFVGGTIKETTLARAETVHRASFSAANSAAREATQNRRRACRCGRSGRASRKDRWQNRASDLICRRLQWEILPIIF